MTQDWKTYAEIVAMWQGRGERIRNLEGALEEMHKGLVFLLEQKLITTMPTETLIVLAKIAMNALKGSDVADP